MEPLENTNSDRVDKAVSARLRRLSSFPVDVTRLEQRLQSAIPRRNEPAQRMRMMRLLRPLAAAAASVTILVIIAAMVLSGSSDEAMASAAQMAESHREIVAGHIPVTRVDSIDAASRVLAEKWPGSPDLPQAPEAHVMACCMKSIGEKKVACVLLRSEGAPITMSVARSSDMRSPAGQVLMRNGQKYHVVSHDVLNMVSTERNGRWVCLIGEVDSDRLVDMAEKLEF